MVANVLAMAGVTAQTWAMMYKEVVNTVLLYGSESWVVTDAMLKVMEGFHHILAQRIAGMKARRVREGGW